MQCLCMKGLRPKSEKTKKIFLQNMSCLQKSLKLQESCGKKNEKLQRAKLSSSKGGRQFLRPSVAGGKLDFSLH